MSVENVSTVQQIYAAFGQGDVEAVLQRVLPDTSWDFAGGRPEVPWHRPVSGAAELPGGKVARLRHYEDTAQVAAAIG